MEIPIKMDVVHTYLVTDTDHLVNSEFMLTIHGTGLTIVRQDWFLAHEVANLSSLIPLEQWTRLPFETIVLLLQCRGSKTRIHDSWKATRTLTQREMNDVLAYRGSTLYPTLLLDYERYDDDHCTAIVKTTVCNRKTNDGKKLCDECEKLGYVSGKD
jgi:hypothetical protein